MKLLVYLEMNKERYDYTTNSNLWIFEFVSDGPNGVIKKMIRYSLQNEDGFAFFNLAFGDFNAESGEIDDRSVSNNNDKDKILATIAATVREFTSFCQGALVYARGSTAARTRLYQMAIASNLEEISELLFVYGYVNGQWVDFELGVNYQAFMVLRK